MIESLHALLFALNNLHVSLEGANLETVRVETVEVIESLSTEEIVRVVFRESPIMSEIIRCESGYRQFDSDGDVLRGKVNSKDVGLAQINEAYHLQEAKRLGLDIYSVEGNLLYAKVLYQKNKTKDWTASRKCWQPFASR